MQKNISLRLLIVLVVLVLVAWLGYLCTVYLALPEWQSRGQFGDIFGGLNALFSGFAFAAIFVTLALQGKQLTRQEEQLDLQRTELKLQTKQMSASTAELEKQVKAQTALAEAAAEQAASAAMATRLTILNSLVGLVHFDDEVQHVLGRIFDDDLSFSKNPGDGYCVIATESDTAVVTAHVEKLLNQLQMIGHLRDSNALQNSDLRSIRFETIMTGRSSAIRQYLRFLNTDYQTTSGLPHDHFKSFKSLYLRLELDDGYGQSFQDCLMPPGTP